MKKLFAFLSILTFLFSCNKDDMLEKDNQNFTDNILAFKHDGDGHSGYKGDLKESIPNYDLLVQATSKWIGTASAKEWIMDAQKTKNRRLDEILLLEILCSEEGDNFKNFYNHAAAGSVNKESLYADIKSSNEMLCLKIDYIFEEFVADLPKYTPVITHNDQEKSYLNGELFDPEPVFAAHGGSAIVHFKISEAINTTLFDPATKKFNTPIEYDICDDATFYEGLLKLGDPICSGEIPLNIAYDIQGLFIDICGGGNPPNLLEVEICDNGIDDDFDGLIDCADPDCIGFPDCGGSTDEICNNGIDDDGDGLVDALDPDCFTNDSPCMRDHYLEDNNFHELELQSVQQIVEMGSNLCHGVVDIANPTLPLYALGVAGSLYDLSSTGSITALEEWYTFLIKIHWGTATGTQGQYQDHVFSYHLFDLVNAPITHMEFFTVGDNNTGGGGGGAILFVDKQGLTETLPMSLGSVPFFVSSDICGINNWDPGLLGDQVAFYLYETDQCRLNESTGETSTTSTTKTHTSGFNINLGLRSFQFPLTGGILYQNSNTLATNNSNSISSTYSTNNADELYCGKVNYSYCWSDQGTPEQIHELSFGNIMHLRTIVNICN